MMAVDIETNQNEDLSMVKQEYNEIKEEPKEYHRLLPNIEEPIQPQEKDMISDFNLDVIADFKCEDDSYKPEIEVNNSMLDLAMEGYSKICYEESDDEIDESKYSTDLSIVKQEGVETGQEKETCKEIKTKSSPDMFNVIVEEPETNIGLMIKTEGSSCQEMDGDAQQTATEARVAENTACIVRESSSEEYLESNLHEDGPYACRYCGDRYFSNSSLYAHVKTHTGIGLLRCSHCTFKTPHHSNLKRHLYSHTGAKPFACKYCDYKCAQKQRLLCHMRQHNILISPVKDRPYECSDCGARYIARSWLNKHIKKTHQSGHS